MENFEKVEKLVEKANVTYEDAKKALDQANGDMLDAMIILEKQGKARKPEQSIYRTNPEADTRYNDVPAVIENSKKEEAKTAWKKFCDGVKRGFQYTVDNSLCVKRHGETVLKLPLWISIIVLLCAWHLLLVVFVISLFLECRYSIEGKDNPKEVNDILNQATDIAENVKGSFAEANVVEETVEAATEAASEVQTEDKAE